MKKTIMILIICLSFLIIGCQYYPPITACNDTCTRDYSKCSQKAFVNTDFKNDCNGDRHECLDKCYNH